MEEQLASVSIFAGTIKDEIEKLSAYLNKTKKPIRETDTKLLIQSAKDLLGTLRIKADKNAGEKQSRPLGSNTKEKGLLDSYKAAQGSENNSKVKFQKTSDLDAKLQAQVKTTTIESSEQTEKQREHNALPNQQTRNSKVKFQNSSQPDSAKLTPSKTSQNDDSKNTDNLTSISTHHANNEANKILSPIKKNSSQGSQDTQSHPSVAPKQQLTVEHHIGTSPSHSTTDLSSPLTTSSLTQGSPSSSLSDELSAPSKGSEKTDLQNNNKNLKSSHNNLPVTTSPSLEKHNSHNQHNVNFKHSKNTSSTDNTNKCKCANENETPDTEPKNSSHKHHPVPSDTASPHKCKCANKTQTSPTQNKTDTKSNTHYKSKTISSDISSKDNSHSNTSSYKNNSQSHDTSNSNNVKKSLSKTERKSLSKTIKQKKTVKNRKTQKKNKPQSTGKFSLFAANLENDLNAGSCVGPGNGTVTGSKEFVRTNESTESFEKLEHGIMKRPIRKKRH